MALEIKSTLRETPIRLVLYGADGLGKSTFCAGAPGVCFVDVEGGLTNIDTQAVRVESWKELLDTVAALITDDRCKSIAIDSLDWAEQLCWNHVCEIGDDKGKKKNIEAFGWGKGYNVALNEWRRLITLLERAGAVGKHVLLIAHATRKGVKNPSGEDYEQWQIKLHEKAASLFREWARVVAFAEFDIATVTSADDGGRTKGVWSGRRILRCSPAAGYQGKTRLTMPAKMPLEWQSFAAAVAAGKPPSIEELIKQLNAKLDELAKPEVRDGCFAFLDGRGRSLASLTEAIATVQGYLSEKTEQKES